FVAVVAQDVAQLGVLRRVRALLIPIDRFELLHQAGDRAVQIARRRRQMLFGFVKARRGHAGPPVAASACNPLDSDLRKPDGAEKTEGYGCLHACGSRERAKSRRARDEPSRPKADPWRSSTSTATITRSTT